MCIKIRIPLNSILFMMALVFGCVTSVSSNAVRNPDSNQSNNATIGSAIGSETGTPKNASIRPEIIILLGAPGSGKGTQAVKLSENLKLPHISTGDLFRENLKNNTELGKKAKTYMETGKLVPDEIVEQMLFDRVSKSDAAEGYILDGFPRNLAQAKAFEKELSKKKNVLTVVYIKVSDDELINRIVERGKKSAVKRSDDTAEVAKKRLKVYHEETEPLVSYYEKKKNLITIDGAKKPDQVFQDIIFKYRERQNQNTAKE